MKQLHTDKATEPGREPGRGRGFALLATLTILAAISLLTVAFMALMRTEERAADNFAQRERAVTLAHGMLHRIMADLASPEIQVHGGGGRLNPFAVDDYSKLPTPETAATYHMARSPANRTALQRIYTMPPTDLAPVRNSTNGLVRVSRQDGEGVTAGPAYDAASWAYAGQADDTRFHPAVLPEWVTYLINEPEDPADPQGSAMREAKAGEVAYAVWDESGRFDINLAGADGITDTGQLMTGRLNGLAPHDLGLERLVAPGNLAVQQNLLTYLNGFQQGNQARNRSNFSLRSIDTNTGNDRWFFSLEEMLAQESIGVVDRQSPHLFDLTTYSRDFDVRPEWDGDRAADNARRFLKFYLNEPTLFQLFSDPINGAELVMNTLDEQSLEQRLRSFFAADPRPEKPDLDDPQVLADWMSVMRMLAVLRRALPTAVPPNPASNPLPLNGWTQHDIYGIALNVMQATAPPDDQQLFAYDRRNRNYLPFTDPHVRIGIKVSPYITEAAIRVERIPVQGDAAGQGRLRVTEFWEIWNPYAVDLSDTVYRFGSWAGGGWDGAGNGTTTTIRGMAHWGSDLYTTRGPGPGQFKVLSYTREVQNAHWNAAADNPNDFILRTRPYLYPRNFYSDHVTGTAGGTRIESTNYVVTIGPFNTAGGSDRRWNLVYHIPAEEFGDEGDVTWYSFQIDDPRMGPMSRYNPGDVPSTTQMNYSWQSFEGSHSLFGERATESWIDGQGQQAQGEPYLVGGDPDNNPKQVHPLFGDGFNENFGSHFPPDWAQDGLSPADQLARVYATFALPGRPFQHLGEIASVYANRPWRTLSFADPQFNFSDLLDYYTTIGTTTMDRGLSYKNPGAVEQPGINQASADLRRQDLRWLFERVEDHIPEGNLRPIRGRININTASEELLTQLLAGRYRVIRNVAHGTGGPHTTLPSEPVPGLDNEVYETLSVERAAQLAREIISDRETNGPFRRLSDLAGMNTLRQIKRDRPGLLADAVLARLAQFGTVRQQIYTFDIRARAFHPRNENLVTAEVRMRARVGFDSFTRRSFIESIDYR